MKNSQRWLSLTFIISFGFLSSVAAQEAASKMPRTTANTTIKRVGVGAEEKVVKAAYAKLAAYNRAAIRWQIDRGLKFPNGTPEITFDLRNFRAGAIQEILELRNNDLVTPPFGEILSISHATVRENEGPEQATYPAQWTKGQYASFYDRQWTIGDIMRFEPAKYFDVGKYTSYEVSVSFEGRSRTYRALVLFHDLYKSDSATKSEFWDSVVGMGGTLTQVWEEQLSPYGATPNAAPTENPARTDGLNPPDKIGSPAPLAYDSVREVDMGLRGSSMNVQYLRAGWADKLSPSANADRASQRSEASRPFLAKTGGSGAGWRKGLAGC